MGVVSQECSMALEEWGHIYVGMVCMGIARHRDMRLDGPVGVGKWYGIE